MIDEFDKKILYELICVKDKITITSMAKKVFDKIESDYDLKKKESFIRFRIKKLLSFGLVIENKIDNALHYKTNKELCILKKGKIIIKPNGKDSNTFLLIKSREDKDFCIFYKI